jgi:hypothetical protein
MAKKLSGRFVQVRMNLGLHKNGGANPFWIAEFRGPDGLRYLATVFDAPGMVSVTCIAAPMRFMPCHAWEPELRAWIDDAKDYMAAQDAKHAPAQPNAASSNAGAAVMVCDSGLASELLEPEGR